MAAEQLAAAGHRVDVFDAMPSVARKLLIAGVGGLNLTHSEPPADFASRYGEASGWMVEHLAAFGAEALRAWAAELGVETFVGSSGRVFPVDMKAAPLLRAWLHRLRGAGVRIRTRHRWLGWREDSETPTSGLRFDGPEGETTASADAIVLALGGGSWSRLGSDGAWLPWLQARGVDVSPLRPANCGFEVSVPTGDGSGWGGYFANRFAGQALKNITLRFTDSHGVSHERIGECIVTVSGLEGSLVYAFSKPIRDTIEADGPLEVHLDLAPSRSLDALREGLSRPRGRRSLASHLQSKAGITGVKAGLMREVLPKAVFDDMNALANAIKSLPLCMVRPRPLDEAISSAGGVRLAALDAHLMLQALPGVFCCGEMLDWEAPTGGYLLTGCFSTGRAAGLGAAHWLAGQNPRNLSRAVR
jgi:uncharacterized flavoprotein (TIGR03862 family)